MEINNSHFIIEKAHSKGSFEEVGMIESDAFNGMSDSPINYQFIDDNNTNEIAIYRLKQVDIDGKISFFYSKAIHSNSENIVEISPNPTNNEFEISSYNAMKKIEFYNIHGKLLKLIETENHHIIIQSKLPTGYFKNIW